MGAMVARPSSSVLAVLCDCVGLGHRFDFSFVPVWCSVLCAARTYRLLKRTPVSDGRVLCGLSVVSLLCLCGGYRQGAFSFDCLAGGCIACCGLEFRILLRLDSVGK